jgi:hypothetical protein
MAVPDHDPVDAANPAPAAPDAFLEESYLTYIVPFATRFDPREAFRQVPGSVERSISAVEQRDQLFFGMEVRALLPPVCPGLLIPASQTRPSMYT